MRNRQIPEIAGLMSGPAPGSGMATTAGHPTVVSIQYLRAVAASLVVYHHAFAPPAFSTYYRTAFAEFGVDLFFVISGYIMWTTTVGGHHGPGSFWAARILRVVPLYWMYSTLFLVAATMLAPQAIHTPPGLDPIFVLKSYLFVPAEHPHTGNIVPVYSLGWTLNYEMFFYFLFGLSLLLVRPFVRFWCLASAFLMLALAGLVAQPQQPLLSTYTNPILLEFLAGVVLGALHARLTRGGTGLGVPAIVVGVTWLIFALLSDPMPIRIVAYGLPATLIVGGCIILESLARRRPDRIFLTLGDASYSIYLAHPFAQRIWFLGVFYFFPTIKSPVPVALVVIGAILVGILAGVMSWLAVERPLLAVGRKLIKPGIGTPRSAQELQ